MKTCFTIMQFNDHFSHIEKIISAAVDECKMKYKRGDLIKKSGTVMPQIVHEIKQAAVVVADITGYNPNVLYELGIAHQIMGQERVVIITQKVKGKPAFDINQYRQFVYSDDEAGLEKLRKELVELINEASKATYHETWSIIRGNLPRTNFIIGDLERLLNSPDQLKGITIRIAASLSSISISDHEASNTELRADYHEALIKERNLLIEILAKGAKLKAVLNPPHRFAKSMVPERLSMRYRRLIGLLDGNSDIENDPLRSAYDLIAIKQCEIALSPVPMPNLFIIGNEVAYEGVKRTGAGGFDMTHCETSPEELNDIIKKFDKFFQESNNEMNSKHPPDGHLIEQLRKFYNDAIAYANM